MIIIMEEAAYQRLKGKQKHMRVAMEIQHKLLSLAVAVVCFQRTEMRQVKEIISKNEVNRTR